MSDSFQYDAFLSHNAKDKPRVRRLAERLKAAGVRVWLDEWVIKAGDIIALKVDEGLEHSRVLLLCISPAALASGWVALERSTAVHRDPANEGRRFIPLLLEDCPLPDTLRRYKYLDLREESDAAFAEVVAACRPEPASAPAARQTEVQKTPAVEKRKPVKPPEETKPLAVLERSLTGHKHVQTVNSVRVGPDGTWVASGADDETIKTWDTETGECRRTFEGHKGRVYSIAITPDGKRILSCSSDRSVRVWDASSGKQLAKLDGHTGEVWSVVALRDNARALSGGWDGTLRLWDLASRSCLKTIECGSDNSDQIFSSAVNREGNQALSGHRNGRIRLWNLESGACLARLNGHSQMVMSVQITPDGRFAISGSNDRTVKVWDLGAGNCVGTLEGHQKGIDSVAVSPDGTLMASTGFTDHTVRLWDWKSGVCLQVIDSEGGTSPYSATFSADGSRLVVGTAGASIYLYRLTAARPSMSAQATRCYVNAKVVLLGEGAVGKTSLAHRLIEDRYVVQDRTHGMNVWRLELPLAPDATLEREALLWDLAGQEDYRLIHQLFLEETALALLLINPQKEDPFLEAGDWLSRPPTTPMENGTRPGC
jgi:WD40 repeat protein